VLDGYQPKPLQEVSGLGKPENGANDMTKSHSFETAFHQYACHLQDNLGQSASNREYICRESSGLDDSSGAFILRDVFGNESARINGNEVTL